MEINAIDSHCHIRYAPKETIKKCSDLENHAGGALLYRLLG